MTSIDTLVAEHCSGKPPERTRELTREVRHDVSTCLLKGFFK